ncbi:MULTISPECIES: S-layer homology domain-containing protein [Bacillus]|uniref:S-layer homology domain-containing protein n=1 Tax=Bacillus TaxID=1386 RepID=UPI0004DD2BCC|nr:MULTISPECIES: S-layer homology domain-containing protein [Bacillus]KZE01649.1 S-layer protein EA1 [Bacillus mycoides]MBG9721570.1 S-layer protein [Bacillus mycoides]MBJ8016694.1 S-layer homology domain-containing protein [Bacillus cereus group sp. N34]MCP9225771.1 S-layer homology domain-containing protein [Bacillus mycoides]OOQ99836.1 S-layer protein [Bacillus mycoides]
MAKTNSYKKVIAGTMTAAMVAGVVSPVAAAGKSFPDVPADHWALDSINYLVDKGAIKGKPDGTYGPAEAIDRASAAVIFTQILGLPVDENAQPSFKDAKNTWAAKYIAAVEKAGIVKGDGKDNFYPEGKIDRASFASMLVGAYNLKEKVDGTLVTTFDDLRGHWGEEKANILINLGISVGTGGKWEPNKTVSRAEAAQFIAVTDKKYAKSDNSVAKVTNVTATEPTQLTLTGTGLNNLTAEDVTLEGNKAIALEASKDGKSAVVTLSGKIAPNKELPVKVKGDSFNVKYVYEVKKLRVEQLTFDDDRADQAVVFKLNEEKGNADIEYLDIAGHDVKFVANKLDGTPANIFEGGTAESTTGKLAVGIDEGKYKVEVQVTKRGGITVSNTGIIEVKNLDAEATAIKDVVFAVDTDKAGVNYAKALSGTDFTLNSKTLVAGEKAGIHKVVAQINKENKVVDPSAIILKSSNPGVISVKNGEIKAEAAGSATITVKVGDVTKSFDFVVKTDTRKLTTVKANPDQLKVVDGKELPVTFVTTDQYGDPFGANEGAIKEVFPQTGAVTALEVITTNEGSIGTSSIKVKGAKVGAGTIHFQNPNASGEGYGSLHVEVTKSNIGHEAPRLELVSKAGQKGEAADTTLGAGNTVNYQLSNYTTEGVYADAADLAGYELRVGNEGIASAKIEGKTLKVTGKKAGVTDVILTKDGATAGHATITVTQENIQITSVKFKDVEVEQFENRKVNIDRVLDVVKSDKDDVLNGIKLNISTEHKVRIVDEGTEQGKVYLDRNDNATFDGNDVALGYVTAVKSNDTVSKEGNELFSFLTDETVTEKNDVFKGVTTAFGDKGTVIFKVVKDRLAPTTEYGTKAVTINVIKEKI